MLAGNVRAFATMGNLMLVLPSRKAQLKKRIIIGNENTINERSTPQLMYNRDKMLKFAGQAPMCANAMLAGRAGKCN